MQKDNKDQEGGEEMEQWRIELHERQAEIERLGSEQFKSELGKFAYSYYDSPDEIMAGTGDIRLGSRLGDALCGSYDLSNLDHEARVMLLHDLTTIQAACMNMGWHEHTGDWDWRVVIKLDDGSEHGTHDDSPDEDYVDELNFWSDNYYLKPPKKHEVSQVPGGAFTARRMKWGDEDYTVCVDAPKITHVIVEEYDYEGETKYIELEIDRIKEVNIWYDT